MRNFYTEEEYQEIKEDISFWIIILSGISGAMIGLLIALLEHAYL